MAQNAPASVDVQEIQFKLHDKFTIFSEGKELKSLVSLLAVSSTKGLLFAGNPNEKELKVVKIKDVVDAKTTGRSLHVRVVTLPGEPKSLACSCDGSMLAVNYVTNNTGFLQVYQVDSFVTPNINTLYNVPVSPESYVFALQLLWNPVIANNIALILNDGSVTMFSLNPGGQYDKVTLGKEHQVKSGCWSPKGKQIVFGFAEGKLQQFKPNLQPARAILCPPGIHPAPFDCIAVHWLSTFQFAAVFLQRGEEMCPTLFIVNAPKAGNPSYINYFDICYSAPGPRTQQLTLNHISPWNLLLVSSANGVEVGILGTKESGENPTWVQYTLLDEARIEMPLTEAKDETYPIGFVFDTASSHNVKIGEQSLPVMPMIHVLSTHGHLVSFNFLNLSPNTVDVCSPPPPINDISGQFRPVQETIKMAGGEGAKKANANETVVAAPIQSATTGFGEMTFTLGSNMVTSTPAIKDKPTPMFGSLAAATAKPSTGFGFGGPTAPATSTANVNKPSASFGFGTTGTSAAGTTTNTTTSTAPAVFGGQAMNPSFGGFASAGAGFGGVKPAENRQSVIQTSIAAPATTKAAEVNKPLYTVPPTFKPPSVVQPSKSSAAPKVNMNSGEIDEVVKQMIAIQIEAFETEMKQIQTQARKLMENIGKPEEIKSYTKHLNDLQELIEQANDHEFEQDVQSLRHSMNESYAMLAECRTKLDMYNNPNLTRLTTVYSADPANRRQLAKLQSYTATNQTQLNQLNHLIDAQWSQYQDIVRRNTKNHMHIPCLDGVYQRMSKLKDLLARQRTKMNHIRSKLKQKGLSYKPPTDVDVTTAAVGALTKNQSTMESLADSILSMSLSQVVSQTHAKLSEEKLSAIRNFTRQQQQITIIKPKRPDRIGLKSEVILETKLETERKRKEIARQNQQMPVPKPTTPVPIQKPIQQVAMQTTQMPKQLQQQHPPMGMQMSQQQPFLAKPTASKPPLLPNAAQPATFITPSGATPSGLSFGSSSSFVKTSAAPSQMPTKFEESSRPLAASTPFPPFGTGQGLGFGQPKPVANQKGDSKENAPANTPISFSPKVIGGNDAKPLGSIGNKPSTAGDGFTALSANKPPSVVDSSNKDNKKSDDNSKAFGFAGIPSTLSTTAGPASASAGGPPTFGGFGSISKSIGSTVGSTVSSSAGSIFSSTMFGSTAASTPFSVVSSTSSAPFATSSSFSFNPVSSTTSVPSTVAVGAKTTAKTSAPVTAAPTKPIANKPTEASVATAAATPSQEPTSTAAGFSFGGLSLDSTAATVAATVSTTGSTAKSSATSNVAIGSTATTESTKSTTAEPPSTTKPTPATSTSTDPTDSLFGNLNICKPDTKQGGGDVSKTSTNIFSGFAAPTSTTSVVGPFAFASGSGAGDGAKSFLATPASTTTSADGKGFSFGSVTSTTSNVLGKSGTAPTEAAVSTSAPATAAATPGAVTPSTTATSVTAASTTATAVSTLSSSSSFSFGTSITSSSSSGSLFVPLSSATTVSTPGIAATTSAAAVSTATSSIFGGGNTGSSIFGQSAATSTAATTGTTSVFGGATASLSSGPSLFGSTAPSTTAAVTPASLFGSTAATTAAAPPSSGSIFGGIPKPDQSVFSTSSNAAAASPAGTGIFAAAAAATQPPAASGGGSIFGGSAVASGFGSSAGVASGGSIFGGGSTTTTSPFGATAAGNTASSIFGAAAAATKPSESGSIFGSPTQQSAASGGSLFGKSTFGQPAASSPQSAGSIFGGSAASQPTSAGGFGSSGGSIFGGGNAANNPASGGSIFGAAAAATASGFGASATSTGFGSFSQPTAAPAFGSPSGGFGAAPGGAFGSPQQQSAFAKPIFGGPPTFGSPPAFGAQPTFGGAPTFGSPKGFGSFGATSPAAGGFGAPAPVVQGAATNKGNIFETLGATNSGLSFGNLAHSTQPPAQQKPTFGGSSFMNYRS